MPSFPNAVIPAKAGIQAIKPPAVRRTRSSSFLRTQESILTWSLIFPGAIREEPDASPG